MKSLGYTGDTFEVVVMAKAIAEANGTKTVENEHLLLGIGSVVGSLGQLTLAKLNISQDKIVETTNLRLPETDQITENPILSQEALETVRRAARAALQNGTYDINSSHLLMGLPRDPETPVGELLASPLEWEETVTEFKDKATITVRALQPDPLQVAASEVAYESI